MLPPICSWVTAQFVAGTGSSDALRLNVYSPVVAERHARNLVVVAYEAVAFAWMMFWESTHQLKVV